MKRQDPSERSKRPDYISPNGEVFYSYPVNVVSHNESTVRPGVECPEDTIVVRTEQEHLADTDATNMIMKAARGEPVLTRKGPILSGEDMHFGSKADLYLQAKKLGDSIESMDDDIDLRSPREKEYDRLKAEEAAKASAAAAVKDVKPTS